ncbi:hypothetical protein CANCADRAFT_1662 [Tortispora caseinolytica NRRL Y-17796]|uniref:Serine/threonine-protein kinase n=1 Tax=Tortispora caseinolytica NRRL Y-17796 TaxID=767744 RepID=A0A1E4TDT6_9ASCO|nr:hypothetical protein CANCADRAFT_1662 [Tortispora caseinolytica NRRL Y-17796]
MVLNDYDVNRARPAQGQQLKRKAKASSFCKTPPKIIKGDKQQKYRTGPLLGEGGFGRCFKVQDHSGVVYAAKTIAKCCIKNTSDKTKLLNEVQIHKSMIHNSIVKFYDCFEDDINFYMILELCRSHSLADIIKTRGVLMCHEVRYFLLPILSAVQHLHKNKIIHRDLKPGNILVDQNMRVKLGDFGMATQLTSDRELKKSICGTPNYMAPEILAKDSEGYSYPVDIWSIGCMMYTMFVGVAPFHDKSVEKIYARILDHCYSIPATANLTMNATETLRKLLSPNPRDRPSPAVILNSEYCLGSVPEALPKSAVHFKPLQSEMNFIPAKDYLISCNENPKAIGSAKPLSGPQTQTGIPISAESHQLSFRRDAHMKYHPLAQGVSTVEKAKRLENALMMLLDYRRPDSSMSSMSQAEPGAFTPHLLSWVDYSGRYGLGYTLSDSTYAVLFNDGVTLAGREKANSLQHVDTHGKWTNIAKDANPLGPLADKLDLLSQFFTYMTKNLSQANPTSEKSNASDEEGSLLPYVVAYHRLPKGIAFIFNSGQIQYNLSNHDKCVVSSDGMKVRYIKGRSRSREYDTISIPDSKSPLLEYLQDVRQLLCQIIKSDKSGSSMSLPVDSMRNNMSQAAVVAAAAAAAAYRPLNVKDALSYLDQVKVQFQNQPDVYNRFLDIMKDFKSQSIDTPGVIDRVSNLFAGHPNLIQGFNTFLPPGYRIECSNDPSDPNPIRVTTPMGTTTRPDGSAPIVDSQRWDQQNGSQQPQPGMQQNQEPQDQQQQQPQPPQQPQQPQQPQPSRPVTQNYQYADQPSQPAHSRTPSAGFTSAQSPQLHSQGPAPLSTQSQQAPQVQQHGLYLGQTGPNSSHMQINQPPRSQVPTALPAPMQPQQQGPMISPQQATSQHMGGQFMPVAGSEGSEHNAQPLPYAQSQIYQQQQLAAQTLQSTQSQDLPANPERRHSGGPVEFNQAISYVNKIKNRFASQPDIYKNFLEILQTYQRDQKPIGEVYTQVTALFREAPDLLDDFKQFLPDTSQQPPVPPMTAVDNRGPSDYMYNGQSRLPPVGNFAPPVLAGKEKKRRASEYTTDSQTAANRSNKRRQVKDASISPNLIPSLPVPLAPSPPPLPTGATSEEISFFDRAKKFIGNKQTYNEFLKVLNLFTNDLIDKNTLVERVDGFLGGNKELVDWFKRFVGYTVSPLEIENFPGKKHRLELSFCKAEGPSYRQLPRSETLMPSSGRDAMCWDVLNDEWVGHPTWASEDSGFVAHRKNQYEEILHRVEEERHEYDHFIGLCTRSIQLMEPIANRISNMTVEERANFKLPPGLGHTSPSIYRKVLKKIYDPERAAEVVDAIHENPTVAVPIVLRRLKQKAEEWKRAQREWNKIWRETEAKVFYKSLDHRGLTFKQTDKRTLTSKYLLTEIETVKNEPTNKKGNPLTPVPKKTLVFEFKQKETFYDILRLLNLHIENSSYSAADKERMEVFISLFISTFFGIPQQNPKAAENIEEPDVSKETSSVTDNKNTKPNLLRDVLKKSKHAQIIQSASSGETNGEVDIEATSTLGDADYEHAGDIEVSMDQPPESWIRHANGSSNNPNLKDQPVPCEIAITERHQFSLYGNATIYCFFRLLQICFDRLNEVKNLEETVSEEIRTRKPVGFAKDLGIISTKLADMGLEFKPENCYGQLLALCELNIEGEIEQTWFEEALRHAYRNRAFKVYTIDKLLGAIAKQIHSIITDSVSSDMILLFENDRAKPTTTIQEQISYRIHAEAEYDDQMFRIVYDTADSTASIQYLTPSVTSASAGSAAKDKWNYYVTSYVNSSPTEGLLVDLIRTPFIRRSFAQDIDEINFSRSLVKSDLDIRICLNTYKLFFEPDTQDVFIRGLPLPPTFEDGDEPEEERDPAKEKAEVDAFFKEQVLREQRFAAICSERLAEFWNGPNGWINIISGPAEAENATKLYDIWIKEGPEALDRAREKLEAEAIQTTEVLAKPEEVPTLSGSPIGTTDIAESAVSEKKDAEMEDVVEPASETVPEASDVVPAEEEKVEIKQDDEPEPAEVVEKSIVE